MTIQAIQEDNQEKRIKETVEYYKYLSNKYPSINYDIELAEIREYLRKYNEEMLKEPIMYHEKVAYEKEKEEKLRNEIRNDAKIAQDLMETIYSTKDHKTQEETVNHPSHYNTHPSGVECIDIVEHFDFLIGNVIKYAWRAGLKDNVSKLEDLKKMTWYANRAVEKETKK